MLQPYSRVNTENPYPILNLFPDLLMLTGLRKVVVLPAVPTFKCHLPGNFLRLNFSSNSLVFRKIIPYSRPKLSDFYTLNSLKTIPFTAAHTYIAHIWEYPPPPPELPTDNNLSNLLVSAKLNYLIPHIIPHPMVLFYVETTV